MARHTSVCGGPYDASYNLTRSYVLVMNTKTLQLVDTITTDLGVGNLLYNGKYLFASNNNFGGSSTVSVIDPSIDKRVNQFTKSAGPAGMVLDSNGKLWVITTGTDGGNDGALYRVNPSSFAIEQAIPLAANPGTSLAITADGKTIYYSVNSLIYDAKPSARQLRRLHLYQRYRRCNILTHLRSTRPRVIFMLVTH